MWPPYSSKDWQRRMDALRLAHGIWRERALSSHDARHASTVLEAMLRRLSVAPAPSASQLSWSAPTPAPSSDSTQEGFVGFFSVEAEACGKNTEPLGVWVDHQNAETDSSFDVVDLMPLDHALDNPESLDWVSPPRRDWRRQTGREKTGLMMIECPRPVPSHEKE